MQQIPPSTSTEQPERSGRVLGVAAMLSTGRDKFSTHGNNTLMLLTGMQLPRLRSREG